jgi:hypothetical protein
MSRLRMLGALSLLPHTPFYLRLKHRDSPIICAVAMPTFFTLSRGEENISVHWKGGVRKKRPSTTMYQ